MERGFTVFYSPDLPIFCEYVADMSNLMSLYSQYISTLAFIVAFSTFLFSCIDYSLIREKKMLSDVIRPQCMRRYERATVLFGFDCLTRYFSIHGFPATFLISFSIWWTWQFLRLLMDIPQLMQMYRLFHFVLEIPDVCTMLLEHSIPWLILTYY